MLGHCDGSPLRSALHMERYSEMYVWQHCLRLWHVVGQNLMCWGGDGQARYAVVEVFKICWATALPVL